MDAVDAARDAVNAARDAVDAARDAAREAVRAGGEVEHEQQREDTAHSVDRASVAVDTVVVVDTAVVDTAVVAFAVAVAVAVALAVPYAAGVVPENCGTALPFEVPECHAIAPVASPVDVASVAVPHFLFQRHAYQQRYLLHTRHQAT